MAIIEQAKSTEITEKCDKRGIFGFVGQIGSALFGTATTSDVQAIAKANEEIAERVEGVIIDQRKAIAKVNAIDRCPPVQSLLHWLQEPPQVGLHPS